MTIRSEGIKSLKNEFKNLDAKVKGKLADIEKPKLHALAALKFARELSSYEYLSAQEIEDVLESADVSVKALSIERALASSGDLVRRRTEDNRTVYKVMTRGIRKIEPYLKRGNVEVIFVEAGNRAFGFQDIKELFQTMNGKIKICDPYFGEESIDKLVYFAEPCEIIFLTKNVRGDHGRLNRKLRAISKDNRNYEVRYTARNVRFHDRYLITSNALLIIGHGLKDIGASDSFVISINKTLVPEAINAAETAFDSKWAGANPL